MFHILYCCIPVGISKSGRPRWTTKLANRNVSLCQQINKFGGRLGSRKRCGFPNGCCTDACVPVSTMSQCLRRSRMQPWSLFAAGVPPYMLFENGTEITYNYTLCDTFRRSVLRLGGVRKRSQVAWQTAELAVSRRGDCGYCNRDSKNPSLDFSAWKRSLSHLTIAALPKRLLLELLLIDSQLHPLL